MKKIIRNAAAIAAVGGVGVYTVYKLVFGKTKKTNDYDSEILKGNPSFIRSKIEFLYNEGFISEKIYTELSKQISGKRK
jgi:hypothetical protein